jgi:glycosyltransferase involved in cell wall biosynthesis
MESQYPKLLIISHNLYDINNNIGKTLVSLLNGWPKDRIAEIYFRNDPPSFNYCSQYYCITDKEVLKSVVSLHTIKAGSVVSKSDELKCSSAENKLYAFGNHRHPSVSLVRDYMWNMGNWKTKELRNWILNTVKPDLILFVPNEYCLAYKVALYVASLVNKPIVPFYMDDTFYFNVHTGIIDSFRRKQIRTLATKIHTYSKSILTICDYMSDVYEKHFKKQCYAFMNSVEISEPRGAKRLEEQVLLTYMGNLHSNRWKSLVEIGKALESIEKEKGIHCIVNIYSTSYLEEAMKDAFNSVHTLNYVGNIPFSQLRAKRAESDILLHVEAFDKRSVDSLMLSLATRIPEYLSTGVPIFAYGPACLSTMRYLTNFDLAQVCYDKEDIVNQLSVLLSDENRRNDLALRGFERAKTYHDRKKVSAHFQEILKNY